MTAILGIGTAGLAKPYAGYDPPSREDAVGLLLYAFGQGIRFADTAPAYGSEGIVGEALRQWKGEHIAVASKCVGGPRGLMGDAAKLLEIQRLRFAIGQPVDVMQLHNATAADLEYLSPVSASALAVRGGMVGAIGASVYGVGDALAAIRHPLVDWIQVAYSVPDQCMDLVMREAREQGKRTIVRSVLLRGRIGERAEVKRWAASFGMTVAIAAIRFVCSHSCADVVLVGARTRIEVREAVVAWEEGPLPPEALGAAQALATDDPDVIDPRRW